ncbi:MAG: glycerophosphodiester phosphodiesterase [Spirochaetes bacterium]|nr:glycerophosphodiester phosphodiesterase [Spirochaetota bacterium]
MSETMPTPKPPIQVMAHRGWPSTYPENTLLGFEKALELGVEILEFDVRLTSDKVPVIIHDATLDRTTTASGEVGAITAAELRRVDAGSRKDPSFAGLPVPTLAETLDLADRFPAATLNVELKDATEENCARTMEALLERGLLQRCVLTSFDARILHHLKDHWPGVRTQGFPGENMSHFQAGPSGTYSKMDFVGFPASAATPARIAEFRALGIIPGAWCVDTVETLEALPLDELEILTTNNPPWLIQTLREKGRRP